MLPSAAGADARARALGLLLRRLQVVVETASPARHAHSTASPTSPSSSSPPPTPGGVGLVFDIDGVLKRGREALPGAATVFHERLVDHDTGAFRAAKAQELSQLLKVPVHERQVVLSHTPFRYALAPRLRHRPVLVAGRGDVGAVARSYGFRAVVTTRELALADPRALPFRRPGDFGAVGGGVGGEATAGEGFGEGGDRGGGGGGGGAIEQQLQQPPPLPPPHHWGTPLAPFAAALVFSDPHDWYADLQLLVDTCATTGAPLALAVDDDGGGSPAAVGGGGDEGPEGGFEGVFFSNPDMEFAGIHPRPRFGQGSFATAFASLHRSLVEGERRRPPLRARFFGKPTSAAARLAERLLVAHAAHIGVAGAAGAAEALEDLGRKHPSSLEGAPLLAGGGGGGDGALRLADEAEEEEPSARRARRDLLSSVFPAGIFMVGDNPRADVRGARRAGAPWTPVLVRTGVFGGGENDAADPADLVVADVRAAVEAALHRARAVKWHSLR